MEGREIRCDPLTGEHVVLSTVRAKHMGYHRAQDRRAGVNVEDCPFCPQNMSATRRTIDEVVVDGAWGARSFANRCPVVVLEESPEARHEGVLSTMGGFGAHEVLVESPEHAPLHEQADHRSQAAFELITRRLRDLRQDDRLKCLHWFRNHGPASGGSQRHPHSQIVGLPYVPERWQRYAGRARHHHDLHGETLLRAMMRDEARDGRRLLRTVGPVTALCPFASGAPFEVWLVPEAPGRGLADATDMEIEALATLTPALVRAVEAAVGTAISYNLTVLGAAEGVDPTGVGWHMRLTPRLARQGGIERGTGNFVNGVFPEEAAIVLRGHLDEG